MKQSELDRITELVTREVLAVLEKHRSTETPDTEGREKVLVIGTPRRALPESLCRRAVLYDLEDYGIHQDVLRYDRIIIASLTMTQLSDIARGRSGDAASCAVVHGLLEGVEVFMPDDAPSYKRYEGKGSAALYRMMEEFERTLRSFGVKNTGREREYPEIPARPPKYAAPQLTVPQGSAQPNYARLITEAEAERIVARGSAVFLPAGTIVTPSARDVFSAAGITVTEE